MEPRFKLDIDIPKNRQVGTVYVRGDDGAMLATDRCNFYSIIERNRLAKSLSTVLKKNAEILREAIEATWLKIVAQQQEKAEYAERLATQGDVNVAETDDDPHRLARLVVQKHLATEGLTLRFWRGDHLRWDGSAYRIVEDVDIRAEVCAAIKQEFDRLNKQAIEEWNQRGGKDKDGNDTPKPKALRVTGRLVSDTMLALGSLVLLPTASTAPSWLKNSGHEIETVDPKEILVCKNGMAYLPTLATEGILSPCTPAFFNLNALDYNYIVDAPPPQRWLDFLSRLWPGDLESIATLQEWFGYCLTPDTRQQKILMLVGPRRSGKGTIARVLRQLVGEANTCAPTLAGLGMNFGLATLLNKTLAIIADARLSGRTDTAVIVERLLALSGEDAVDVDRKHRDQVTAKLWVRFAILTNELPRFTDPSGALVGRLILLRMTESWYGREDTHLTNHLFAELPSILLWAIEGWLRLNQRGRFVQPKSSETLLQDMEDLTNPIGAFARQCCDLGADRKVRSDALYTRWKSWCESTGNKPGTDGSFGRGLRAAFASVDTEQPRERDLTTGEVIRPRYYTGINLKIGEELP